VAFVQPAGPGSSPGTRARAVPSSDPAGGPAATGPAGDSASGPARPLADRIDPAPVGWARLPELEDLPPVAGRRVLVRCDFNVPLRRNRVVDDLRIRSATPTLEWLVRRGARVTVCTHLGRPGGRPDARFDLGPVRDLLAALVPEAELMDNLRFHAGEESGDAEFVRQLMEGQDLFVNDAFATTHRHHASVVGPPAILPSAVGRLVSREVAVLTGLREQPRRPFVAVLGGPADPERLAGLRSLLGFVDTVLLGGPLAFAVMEQRPPAEGEWSDLIDAGQLVLPVDVGRAADGGRGRPESRPGHPGAGGPVRSPGPVDIGRRSATRYAAAIGAAGTVFWDGAMGVDVLGPGTMAVAEAVAAATGFTAASGVDTVAALRRLRMGTYIDHLSTGGAASLAFLRDGDLAGLAAIRHTAISGS
jgi:phosphoglycerate kinase